jgi:hypothetical protein
LRVLSAERTRDAIAAYVSGLAHDRKAPALPCLIVREAHTEAEVVLGGHVIRVATAGAAKTSR